MLKESGLSIIKLKLKPFLLLNLRIIKINYQSLLKRNQNHQLVFKLHKLVTLIPKDLSYNLQLAHQEHNKPLNYKVHNLIAVQEVP